MVERRLNGEPLQYVLGRWGFRDLDLMVDRRVLIPRPETEQVVGWALEAVAPSDVTVAVDLGTGSGAIALALARELARATVWATDVSRDALDVARANTSGAGMWAAPRVRLVEGWWWDALPAELEGRVDLVVSNPPYIADDEVLPAEVEVWEPRLALRAGDGGPVDDRADGGEAAGWLAPGGVLVVEIAPALETAVLELANAAGAAQAEVRADALGRPRALVSRWSGG